MTDINHSIVYNKAIEEYLKTTSEKCYGLSWCHRRSQTIFDRRRLFLDAPIAIVALLNGFISAASTTIFKDPTQSSLIVGIIAILCGILNTIANLLAYSKLAEGHRISALSYARLYRTIAIQLTLPRDKRTEASILVKYVKDTYDSLDETSPIIRQNIINEFRGKFNKPEFTNISKPEITNTLEFVKIYNEDDKQTHIEIVSPKISPDKPPQLIITDN
jgi:hypothetical protein